MKKRIPLATPTLNGSELDFVKEAFDTNWVAPLGPHVDNFEKEIVNQLNFNTYAAALSSGTAAIHLGLKAIGIKPGDIVFATDMTFAATANPIMYENAKPVFIDSEPDSWNMCPDSLEAAFKKYPTAKAVIAVNLYGVPAKLNQILEICNRYGAKLIEDAAESLGSTLDGRQTGTFGHIGILSFNGNKIITTSGGGMLICSDPEIIKTVKFWATQSRDQAYHYEHSQLGYNYRMSNICAGVGRGQLLTLGQRINQKTKIYEHYKKAFSHNQYIKMNPVPSNMVSNHWLSGMYIDPASGIDPIIILEALETKNIESRPVWKPMSLQPFYKEYDFVTVYEKPVSYDVFENGLCLPSDVKMTEEEQVYVCEEILKILNK